MARASNYEPFAPVRLLDTRSGPDFTTIDGVFEGDGPLSGGTSLQLVIAGRGDIPATGVQAAVLNIAAVFPAGGGWITAYPCGSQPNASPLNYTNGAVVANEIIAKLDASGNVCLFSSATTDLVIDTTGYINAPSPQ